MVKGILDSVVWIVTVSLAPVEGTEHCLNELILQEDPAADLEAFLSYETLPSRPTWSGIRRDHYDYVKEVFAQRGVPINSDTREADIIKFKDALLGYTLYFF